MPPNPMAAPPPPEVLPPGYSQVRLLGRGQFGRVFEVRGPGGFNSALKVVNNPSKGEVEFLKEFKSLTTMRRVRPHPHIVPIQGVWLRTQTGEFLADAEHLDQEALAAADMDLLILMELGQKTLGDRYKECRKEGQRGIPARELIKYMDGAGKGLDYLNSEVHDLGGGHPSRIIHCDVKPANLLVFAGGTAKVADYGVARVVGAAARATTAGGSPAYAPPELHGRAGPGPTSDQYSLAITFYELLTGILPLEAGTAFEAMMAHAKGDLDYSKAGPRVQATLRAATALQCDQRFPTCEDFVDALRDAAKADDPGAFPVSIPSQGHSTGIPFPGQRRPASSHDPVRMTPARPGAESSGTITEPPIGRSSKSGLPGTGTAARHTPVPPLPPKPKPDTDPGTGTGTILMPGDKFPPPPSAAAPSGLFETSPFVPLVPPPSGGYPVSHDPDDGEEQAAPWESGTIAEQVRRSGPRGPASSGLPAQRFVGGPPPVKSKTPMLAGVAVLAIAAVAGGLAVVTGGKPKGPEQTQATTSAAATSLATKPTEAAPPPVDELFRTARAAFKAGPEGWEPGFEALRQVSEAYPGSAAAARDLSAAWKHVRTARTQDVSDPDAAIAEAMAPFKNLLSDDAKDIRKYLAGVIRPKQAPTPPGHFEKLLAEAKEALRQGSEGGLAKLDQILGDGRLDRDSPTRREAKELHAAWAEPMRVARELGQGTATIGGLKAVSQRAANPSVEPDPRELCRQLVPRLVKQIAAKLTADDWFVQGTRDDARRALQAAGDRSAWAAALELECGLMDRVYAPDSARPLPDKPLPDSGEGKGYFQFVAHGRALATVKDDPDLRTKAVQAFADATQGVGPDLNVPARRGVAAGLLIAAARRNRTVEENPPADAPFGTGRHNADNAATARDWLTKARGLLGAGDQPEVVRLRNRIGTGLLTAAAFPDPNPELAKDAIGGVDVDALARSLKAADRVGFWLAYVRTRPLKASGAAESVRGLSQLAGLLTSSEDPGDRELLQRVAEQDCLNPALRKPAPSPSGPAAPPKVESYLHPDLRAALNRPDAREVRRQAAEVFLSLGRSLFQPRVSGRASTSGTKSVASQLAQAGKECDPNARTTALAGIYSLDSGVYGEDKKGFYSTHLTEARRYAGGPDAEPLATMYLGIAQFYKTEYTETDSGKRFAGFTEAVGTLERASGPDIRDQLEVVVNRSLALLNIRLANTPGVRGAEKVNTYLNRADAKARWLVENARNQPETYDIVGAIREDEAWLETSTLTAPERVEKFAEAEAAFVESLKGFAESGRVDGRLHLGRCRLKWAKAYTARGEQTDRARKLEEADADLKAVRENEKVSAAMRAEAYYFSADIELVRAKDAGPSNEKAKPHREKAAGYYAAALAVTKPGEHEGYRPLVLREIVYLAVDQAKSAPLGERQAARTQAYKAVDNLKELSEYEAELFRVKVVEDELARPVGEDKEKKEKAVSAAWGKLSSAVSRAGRKADAEADERRRLELNLKLMLIYAQKLNAPAEHSLPDFEAARKRLAECETLGNGKLVGKAAVAHAVGSTALELRKFAAGVPITEAEADRRSKAYRFAADAFDLALRLDPRAGGVLNFEWLYYRGADAYTSIPANCTAVERVGSLLECHHYILKAKAEIENVKADLAAAVFDGYKLQFDRFLTALGDTLKNPGAGNLREAIAQLPSGSALTKPWTEIATNLDKGNAGRKGVADALNELYGPKSKK